MALANIAAAPINELLAAHRDGNLDRAAAIQRNLVPVNRVITREFGVPGLKAAMDATGRFGGPPRLPLVPLNEAGRMRIKTILHAAALL